jgi:glyoxylase-like metal-dependent hydrolase (beta-lactamase superfamily II)
VNTPGHVDKHVSFLINTASAKYAIAGDVFWWEEGQEQKVAPKSLIDQIDPVAKNADVLHKSRANLIDIADCINSRTW